MVRKISQINSFISGQHVMGADPLGDYHAARAARDALRCRSAQDRVTGVKRALKNHRVVVSGLGTCVRIYRPDINEQLVLS